MRGAVSLDPAASRGRILRLLSYAGTFYLTCRCCRDGGRARLLVGGVAVIGKPLRRLGAGVFWTGNHILLWTPKADYLGDLSGPSVNRNSYAISWRQRPSPPPRRYLPMPGTVPLSGPSRLMRQNAAHRRWIKEIEYLHANQRDPRRIISSIIRRCFRPISRSCGASAKKVETAGTAIATLAPRHLRFTCAPTEVAHGWEGLCWRSI